MNNLHHDAYGPTTGMAQSFLYAVYAWMAAALTTTALISYSIAQSTQAIAFLYQNPFILFGLLIVQLGVAIYLSMSLQRIRFATAAILFFTYAALTGVTLSSIFLIYTQSSIVNAFITTSGMFAGMAIYGYFTRTDLSGVASIGIMILWGLIISMLINMFLQSSQFDFIISIVGVILFSLLTAYDMQKLKQISQQSDLIDQETISKIAIFGAFTLYLDFINLFLYLLRLMGQRRK